jgi:hypothetical protein
MTEIGFYGRTGNDKSNTNIVVRMGVKEGNKFVGNGSEASEYMRGTPSAGHQ